MKQPSRMTQDSDNPTDSKHLSDAVLPDSKSVTRKWRPILYIASATLFLLVVFIRLYGPALTLPYSLIDEALYLLNLDQNWANWWKTGFVFALRHDVCTVCQGYKPGASIFYAATYAMFHENRFLMHGMLLGFLAIVTAGLAFIPCLEMRRQRIVPVPVGTAVLAGTIAAFLLLGAEVPGWSGLQAFRANWFRLHTSEPLIAACLVIHTVLLILSLQTSSPLRRILFVLGAMTCILLAGTTKLTAFAHLGPPLLLAVLLALMHHPAWKPWAIAAIASIVIAFIYTAFLKSITPTKGDTYFTAYKVDFAQIRLSSSFFLASFHRMLGPMFFLLLPASIARIICEWNGAGSLQKALERNVLLIYIWLGWAASVAASLPWPHLLPRYLLPAHTLLCMAIGVEIALQAQWWRATQGQRERLWLVAAGIIGVIVMKAGVVVPVMLVLIVVARVCRRPALVQGSLLGALIASMAFFCVFTWISHKAFMDDYVDMEKADGRLVDYLRVQFAKGRVLGVYQIAQDERIGALSIFTARAQGHDPAINNITRPEELTGASMFLVDPETDKSFSPALPVEAAFPRKHSVVRPISYWAWQRDLWNGNLRWPTQEAGLPQGFTIYSTSQKQRTAPVKHGV